MVYFFLLLLLLGMGSFYVPTLVPTTVVNEGQPYRLKCNAPKSVPKSTYSWVTMPNFSEGDAAYPVNLDNRRSINDKGKEFHSQCIVIRTLIKTPRVLHEIVPFGIRPKAVVLRNNQRPHNSVSNYLRY